ncbi:hypothetical protein MMC18_001339 [Xylographa bjoerkii]|nr:hypothetical protein [Xylographa bjoerkii]
MGVGTSLVRTNYTSSAPGDGITYAVSPQAMAALQGFAVTVFTGTATESQYGVDFQSDAAQAIYSTISSSTDWMHSMTALMNKIARSMSNNIRLENNTGAAAIGTAYVLETHVQFDATGGYYYSQQSFWDPDLEILCAGYLAGIECHGQGPAGTFGQYLEYGGTG